MKITFFCSDCGAQLQMDDSFQGKKVRCPNCKSIVNVPTNLSNDVAVDLSNSSNDNLFEDSSSSSFVENEGFSDSRSSDVFSLDKSISNNPYEPPKTVNYYGYQQPEDGMRLTKVLFKSLCGDTFSLLFRYYKEFLFLAFVQFLLDFFLSLLGLMETSSFTFLSQLTLSAVKVVFGFLFLNYLIRLSRTGQTSFLLLKPKKVSMIFKGFVSSFLYGIGVWALAAFFVGAGVFLFAFLGGSFSDISPIVLVVVFSIVGVVILWFYFLIVFQNMFFLPFIFDRNAGVMQSFRLSCRYTKGNYKVFIYASTCLLLPIILLFGTVFGTFSGFVNIMDEPSFIGETQHFFVTQTANIINNFLLIPVSLSLFVIMYLQMTGQETIIREAPKTVL